MRIPVIQTKLIVVPDPTTMGSEGRLCLQLPLDSEFLGKDHWLGKHYKAVGYWGDLGAVMLVESPDGKTVSPRSQLWWKNGVRDHGVRQNYWVDLYMLRANLMVVTLCEPTEDIPPVLPPFQPSIFPGLAR
jgi:hypothetical protein